LPDGIYDAIYGNPAHHYDAVLGDLLAYSEKLRRGGIPFGDDDPQYATTDAGQHLVSSVC
jgi:hypothetical protein